MKYIALALLLLLPAAAYAGQTRRYYTPPYQPNVVYVIDLTTPVVVDNCRRSRGCGVYSPTYMKPFRPSGVTTPTNGGSGSVWRVVGNEVDKMNLSYVVRVKSLPPDLYNAFAKTANEFDTARGAMLRRLVCELPSSMDGNTYVPPSPKAMMQALRKVVYSTDAEVEAFWRAQ